MSHVAQMRCGKGYYALFSQTNLTLGSSSVVNKSQILLNVNARYSALTVSNLMCI